MGKQTRRKSSQSIPNARWAAYAAAGAATVLTSASSAEAEIHYSGVINQKVNGTAAKFPLQSGVSLGFNQFTGGQGGNVDVFLDGSRSGLLADAYFSYGGLYAYRLRAGVNVSRQGFGESCSVTSSSFSMICAGDAAFVAGEDDGYWTTGGTGFIGFLFNRDNRAQYGWARIKIGPPPKYQLLVIDYAWADPGEKIKAGQKSAEAEKAQPVSVPEQGSLALLAAGAAGLVSWRRRRGRP